MSNSGLTSLQAQELLKQYGSNLLPDKSEVNFLNLIVLQFKDVLVLVLFIASALSFFIGDQLEGFLILAILFLNTGMGFWQEYKASKELEALRKLEVATSRCLREGVQIEIASSELVPGDVVLLEAGDKIPADGLLIESYDFSVNESSLTGESFPEVKSVDLKNNVVFFGTTVATGRAKMLINSTGKDTKFGKIALTLNEVKEEQTPLEVQLGGFINKIGLLAVLPLILVFVIRINQGQKLTEVFFQSIALLVAVIPEGLPAVITVLLAIGVHRMYKKKALIRKMSAIESLGATDIICTDKTGTLTMNQMSVKEIFSYGDKSEALKAGIICNSASLIMEEGGSFEVLGDTTEGALLLWAKENNTDIDLIRAEGKIIDELSFDLKRRMMSVIWEEKGNIKVYSKGAPEVVLPLCKLSDVKLNELNKEYKKLASKGLRVLALASKDFSKKFSENDIEKELNFLCLVGIADAPRPQAADAIKKAHDAGIRVVMITGDNELTARVIAEELGMLKNGEEILTGDQLENMTDEELIPRLDRISIFARVIPEHKLRIIRAFQKTGKIVAVTGDGVNDSLALKQAHVGVSMGITGTDVAKEASDIIILDDNLSTLISAIEQGRVIYNNILKVVKFLVAGNLSEMLIITFIAVLGYPNPLLPVQILWINLVTDGLPALSLAFDSASTNLMRVPPRGKSQQILSSVNLRFILTSGVLIAALNIFIYVFLFHFYSLQIARNSVFTAIVVSQMFFIFFMRRHHSITSNKYLLGSVGLILLLQVFILTFSPLKAAFRI